MRRKSSSSSRYTCFSASTRPSTSRESFAIAPISWSLSRTALHGSLSNARAVSRHGRGGITQAVEVDRVDHEVRQRRCQQVAAPEHEGAEQQAGAEGEEGPQPELAAGPGVQQREQQAGGEPAHRALHRAAEEQLL